MGSECGSPPEVSLIFAELIYETHYDDVHQGLVELLEANFTHVESGHQGDSWLWIFRDGDKVEVDTFSSMRHQVKSSKPDSALVQDVIRALQTKYKVSVYSEPELEGHED